MRLLTLAFVLSLALPAAALSLDEYTIDGTFDGCEYGKLYAIEGGGILECQEYNYFYEYRPRVIADGFDVVMIGDEKVSARLHRGHVYLTRVSDEFDGCDFGKIYNFDNGLIFECNTYSYSYSYRPEVTIFIIEGRQPIVFINGRKYEGTLYRRN